MLGLGRRLRFGGQACESQTGMKRNRRSFDPRRHWNQTQARLILGGLAVLVVVGGGLVWAIYGGAAAIAAEICFLGGIGVFALLWLILTLMEKWVKEEEP